MKFDRHEYYRADAFSILDLLSKSGGLIAGIYYAFIPLAILPSRLSFDLGVISLLFMARSAKNQGAIYAKSLGGDMPKDWNYMKVNLSTLQWLKLFWYLYNPFLLLERFCCPEEKKASGQLEGGTKEL